MVNLRVERFLGKVLALIVISGGIWGCSSMAVNNSTNIATDARGYAQGQFSDNRSGCVYSPTSAAVGGGGGGGGGAAGGLGAAWFGWKSGDVPTEGDPMKFARAITLINVSRNLGKSYATEPCGPRENIFTNKPLREKNYQPFGFQEE